ncbi:MAG: hypothetical protein MR446_06315 [Bacteroidales bacterium]|nr:hypothetical protein [Bacteroidales bacterium]
MRNIPRRVRKFSSAENFFPTLEKIFSCLGKKFSSVGNLFENNGVSLKCLSEAFSVEWMQNERGKGGRSALLLLFSACAAAKV